MRAISREGYDRRIFIRADATADYGLVADVMARLSSAGFTNLGLVTDTMDAAAAATSEPRRRAVSMRAGRRRLRYRPCGRSDDDVAGLGSAFDA